jgi:hypothetical protein
LPGTLNWHAAMLFMLGVIFISGDTIRRWK